MSAGPLSWAEQVASHGDYVERHGLNVTAEAEFGSPLATRWRRPTRKGLRNRELVLRILGDGCVHDFGEIHQSIPLSRAGLKWLLLRLIEERRIELAEESRCGRFNKYRLA